MAMHVDNFLWKRRRHCGSAIRERGRNRICHAPDKKITSSHGTLDGRYSHRRKIGWQEGFADRRPQSGEAMKIFSRAYRNSGCATTGD
jgi:hypothetical protein